LLEVYSYVRVLVVLAADGFDVLRFLDHVNGDSRPGRTRRARSEKQGLAFIVGEFDDSFLNQWRLQRSLGESAD